MQKRQYSTNKTIKTTENRQPGQAWWLAYNPALERQGRRGKCSRVVYRCMFRPAWAP